MSEQEASHNYTLLTSIVTTMGTHVSGPPFSKALDNLVANLLTTNFTACTFIQPQQFQLAAPGKRYADDNHSDEDDDIFRT